MLSALGVLILVACYAGAALYYVTTGSATFVLVIALVVMGLLVSKTVPSWQLCGRTVDVFRTTLVAGGALMVLSTILFYHPNPNTVVVVNGRIVPPFALVGVNPFATTVHRYPRFFNHNLLLTTLCRDGKSVSRRVRIPLEYTGSATQLAAYEKFCMSPRLPTVERVVAQRILEGWFEQVESDVIPVSAILFSHEARGYGRTELHNIGVSWNGMCIIVVPEGNAI